MMSAKRVLIGLVVCGTLCGLVGCSQTSKGGKGRMEYQVNRVTGPVTIDANWEKPVWEGVRPLKLTYYMGEKPAHLPKVQAKLAYDDGNIYVIFRVEDRYVRAVAKKHQDSVWQDSCVEFFFTPRTDIAKGYFNLEMNCGGTFLWYFQMKPREKSIVIDAADVERIEVAHTLPKTIDPEITEPTTWTVEYRMPVDVLNKYCPSGKKPAPGVTWRANFYKCGDNTSHPHWLTWSLIDRVKPEFHVPEYFGTLEFK